MTAAKTILAMVSNLMYSVKIREAASKLGATAAFVESSEELANKIREIRPSLVIFELSSLQPGWQEAVQAAKSAGLPMIAYGPHVDVKAREEALQAGIDEVYANSKFNLELSRLLEDALSQA
jgi:CheY-like chemotaxis protein